MKKLTIIIAIVTVLFLLAGSTLADNVQFRLVVSKNDAAVDGEIHVDVEMRIVNDGSTSPRTLLGLTVDIYYSSQLTEWSGNPAIYSSWALTAGLGYTAVVEKLPGTPPHTYYRVIVTGSGVNAAQNSTEPGNPPGWDATFDWQKIVTLRWTINDISSSVDFSIDDGTNAASYFVNHQNVPYILPSGKDAGEDWNVTNEDLVDVAVPVELSLFAAEATDSGIQLSWRTETETENLGFHVFRSSTEDGEYARINEEIIQGAGSSVDSHDYSYTDSDVLIGTIYYYKLADVDFNGLVTFHGPISAILALPEEYALEQNYPNPFNPNTAIKFSLKEPGHVTLEIYNIQGQLIRTLVTKEYNAGRFSVNWEGTNDRGAKVASGIYLYKIEVNGFRQIKRMVFLK